MISRWNETPIWQRGVIAGIAVVLFVGGMYIWVWNPYQQAIAIATNDLADLTQKNQEATRNIASLQGVQREVSFLREKLSSTIQELPVGADSQAFRRKIVNIGQKTGVFIRLWRPQEKRIDREQSEALLDIIVRVEGNFFGTAQFLQELLQFSWIQTINPLELTSKHGVDGAVLVTTEFTIKGAASYLFPQTKEIQKT